jgi:hypothetical protein
VAAEGTLPYHDPQKLAAAMSPLLAARRRG